MDDRFQKGVEKFNVQDFFEAHEVWEELWHEYREADRTFLQGLIQIAAGLYHLDCCNYGGARSQLTKGLKKLEPFRPSHRNVNLEALLTDVSACLSAMDKVDRKGIASFDLELFPFIRSSKTEF